MEAKITSPIAINDCRGESVNSDQETIEKFRSYLYLLTRAHLGVG
jgi:hypothetical protein